MSASHAASVSSLQVPLAVAGIPIPQSEVARAAWRRAMAGPRYLFNHSVRSYFWGARLGQLDDVQFDPEILWPAALLHDVGLTRLDRSSACFEVDGAKVAQRLLRSHGWPSERIERVASAIVLHMQAAVTLGDGAEAVLLDLATSVDVSGRRFSDIEDIRASVVASFPRAGFGPLFAAAFRREAARRPTCASALAISGGIVERIATSPWASLDTLPAV